MSIELTKTNLTRMFLDTPYRDGAINIKNALKKPFTARTHKASLKGFEAIKRCFEAIKADIIELSKRSAKFAVGVSLCFPGINIAIDFAIRYFQKSKTGGLLEASVSRKPRWYILTGGPGSGKTTLCTYLESRYMVIGEAATALIGLELAQGKKEPWSTGEFNVQVLDLQIKRAKSAAASRERVVIFDRSPFDVLIYEMRRDQPNKVLIDRIHAIAAQRMYRPTVFFIENLPDCAQTEIRVETLNESLELARRLTHTYTTHLQKHVGFGHRLVKIPPGTVEERGKRIIEVIEKDIAMV